jgi:type IV pilus assembly protein PilE
MTRMKNVFRGRLKALTLIELLVVLAIIGILVLMALPNLMPLISKAKSAEAQSNLGHIYTLEQSYRYLHSKYSSSLPEINYEAGKLSTEGGNANYRYEVAEAGNGNFKARATAVVDFDGDGTMNVWEIDQDKDLQEVTPD